MQGNKGGPALALSLVHQISKYYEGVQFSFSVPRDEVEFELEKVWGKKYGFEVVRSVGGKHLVPPFRFLSGRNKVFREWVKCLKSSDVLLEMSAICYVGPPINNARGSVGRHILYWLAKFYHRPMIPWTQSYGPFSTWLIRLMAKIDLSSNPIVLCRGEYCREAVQKLLPQIKAMSFPDVATVLPYDKNDGLRYISKNLTLNYKSFVTVSPSAVLYSRSEGQGKNNKHINQMRELCLYIYSQGYDVVLVPHSLYPKKNTPNKCDYIVCEEVKACLSELENIHIIKENLSPIELKSIISNAVSHIGARYHSVVAALSSGVPAVSLSWHPKYKDLMHTYDMENFVFDAINETNIDLLKLKVDEMFRNNQTLRKNLANIQFDIVKEVDKNTEIWLDLYSEKKNEM